MTRSPTVPLAPSAFSKTLKPSFSLLSFLEGPRGPLVAAYGGVHTFLRIRPRSPTCIHEPPCFCILETGGPGGPPASAAMRPATVMPLKPQRPHGPQEHQGPQGPEGPQKLLVPLHESSPKEGRGYFEAKTFQWGPQKPLKATESAEGLKGFPCLGGLPSLVAGKTRALTLPPEITGALPRGGPGDHLPEGFQSGAPEPYGKVSVVVLPSQGGAPGGAFRGPCADKQRSIPFPTHGDLRPAQQGRLKPASTRQRQPQVAGAFSDGVARPPEDTAKGAREPPRGFEGPFTFGGLLGEGAPQSAVFERVGKPAAEAVLAGLNACIAV